MNEQYIKDLYQQLVSIDPLFANDVSFDKFVNSVKDPSYASSLYSQLNQIDNTFKNDVSLDSFLGAVGAVKKKDATAISAGSISASTSPQASSSVSSSSQSTQPSPELQQFAERFMPQQQPTQYPDITGTSVIDVNEFGSPLSQKKKVITVSEADRRKWSGPMEDSNIFASFKNTIETPIQPEETAQQKKEKISFIDPLINSLDSDFVQLDEEAAVPKLQYLFGPLGFKFEESGLGDYVTVTAPDNITKTTIPLDPFFGMGAAKNSEALKNFVRTNAQEIPKEKLDRISNQYVNENKKYATEQEYDNDIKYINDESNKIITEEASISKEYAKLNAERDAINAVPQSQRNNPQYIEKARDLQLRLNALQERVDFIDESKRKLNTNPLMRATGQYAEMKSKQGDPIGAFANNILNGFGRELSSMVSNYIQGVAEAQPNWYLFDKSSRNRDMAFKIAQEKGLKPIEPGQEFMNWFNSLPSDAQKEISGTVRDKEIKSVKYGDEFGGGVTEKIRPVITNLFGDKSVTQEYIKDVERNNFVGGAVLGAAQSIPAMIGPKYMRLAGLLLQGSDFIDEEIQNNPESRNLFTEREKAAIKTVIGIPVALLEDRGFRNLISNSSVVGNLIFRALGKGGAGVTGKTFAEFVKNDIESGLGRAALTAIGGAAAEFETGFFQQAWENTVKAVYNEVYSNIINNPEQRKVFNSPDFWSEDMLMDIFKGGVQEAIGGLVLGVPGSISAGMRDKGFKGISDSQFEVFEEMANDDNILNAWISSLKAKVANGDLKPAEAKEQLNDYRNAVALYRQLPDNLTTQQKKEAMNLIRERNVIQQQIENKDPQLTTKQRNRINQINEQLKVLPENAIQEPEAEGSVLRQEQPEVGLQEVGKGDTQGKETTGVATQEQVIITDEDKARRQSLTDALFIAEELGDDKLMVGDTEMSLQDAKQELADLTLKEEKSKQAPAPAPTAAEQTTDIERRKQENDKKYEDTIERHRRELAELNKKEGKSYADLYDILTINEYSKDQSPRSQEAIDLANRQEKEFNDLLQEKRSIEDDASKIKYSNNKELPVLKSTTTQVSPTAAPTAPTAEQVAPAAPVAEKQNLMSQRNTDLFPDAINFAQEDNDSKLSDYAEENGIGVATYTNPENGLVDTIMTGTSDNDFVGFIRIYENGKPTNKFSSKMSNESGNKENFKTMLSEAQKRLPEGHLYTEKTSVSIDGIRVFSNQLNRGYEIATDENGNPITQDVTLNNASVEGLRNARNQNQKEALYNNKFVKTQEEFEQIKAKILELMPQAKVTFNKPIGRVTISLPVLKSTTTQAAPAVTTTEQVAPTTTEQVAPTTTEQVAPTTAEQVAPAPVAELTIAPTSTPSAYAATQGLAEVETMVAEQERTATTKEQKQNVNTRKRIVATAKRAVNTLKSLFPNAEIFIHTDDNAYNKAMDTYKGKKNSNGNFARWVDADGKENVRIDINLNTATARTVAHEVAHAVLYKAFRDNPQVYKAFHKKLSAILKADANEALNNFASRYTEADRAEEFIVELAGMLEQNQTSIKPSTLQKIAKLINDVVSKLTNGAVKPFEDAVRTIEDAKDVVTFMSNLADAIREGKAISVEQKQTAEGGAEVVSKASLPELSSVEATTNALDKISSNIFKYTGKLGKTNANQRGITYLTSDRNYAAFYESGVEKPSNKALEKLLDLKPPTKPIKNQISTKEEIDYYKKLGEPLTPFNGIYQTQEEVDNANKKADEIYQKELKDYENKYKELEKSASDYLSPSFLYGKSMNLNIDFSKDTKETIFQKLKDKGISTEFKGGNFLDNYESDLKKYAAKNNIDYYDGIKGGIQGSINTSPDEIILINKDKSVLKSELPKAYHKAKKDGSNPELVNAVENLFTEQKQTDAEFISKASLSNQTPDDIVKRGRANGVSEDAIRKVLENKGIETADIDKALGKVAPAGTKVELSEETLPGYNKLVNRINGIIDRGRKKGYSDQKIRDNVVKNVQANDPAYASATNVQQEQIIRDIDKQLGQKQKSAPSKEKVLGKEKKMVLVDDMKSLKEQIRITAKIARDIQKAREDIAKMISSWETSGKITTAQAQTIINKLSKLDVGNQEKVDRFIQYMENVFNDAEYAQKISNIKNKLSTAKKNIKTKIGEDIGLIASLQELFAINPELIPIELLDAYTELVNMMGANQKILPLADIKDVKNSVNDILDKINEQQSRVYELADSFDSYEDKVTDDNDKIDFSATINKMLKEGVITDEDAALMRKYKSDIMPREVKDKATEEEIEAERQAIIKELLNNTTLDGSNLPSRDSRDKANIIKKLLTDKILQRLSINDLKQLQKIIDNINNGYFTNSAQLIMEKMNSIKNAYSLFNSIMRAVPLPITRLAARFKSIFTKKTSLEEMARRGPAFYIDQQFGDFKTKNIFDALFSAAAAAESLFKSDTDRISRRLDKIRNKINQSFPAKYRNSPNALLMSSYKMMTYMIQKEYLSNPGNKQVNPAHKFLEKTIAHLEEQGRTSELNEAEMLREILTKYSTDGQIDLDKLDKSFTQAERDGINEIRKINDELTDKAIHTATVIRGMKIDPLNNYIHLSVIDQYEPSSSKSATEASNNFNKSLNPGTRGKALIERTGTVSALNFDIFSSVSNGSRSVLLDYYMTEPIRTARKTLNQTRKMLNESGKANKEKNNTFTAIKDAFNLAAENLLVNSYASNSFIDDVTDFIAKQGYRATLASVPRFGGELLSNVIAALTYTPKEFAKGVTYAKVMSSEKGIEIAKVLKMKQIGRLYSADALSGKLIDKGIISERQGVRGAKPKGTIANISTQIYNSSLKKVSNSVELIADTLISTPDMMVMRPVWFGSFADKFKELTGNEVDFDKIAANDEAYMNENKDAIDAATETADMNSAFIGGAKGSFIGMLRNAPKPNEGTLTKFYNTFNNYMITFQIYDYIAARTAVMAMVGKGQISRTKGAQLLAAITTRNIVYVVATKMLSDAMIRLFMGGDDEEDDKSVLQKIGQAMASAFTSLFFGRDFGNIARIFINYGADFVNEEFLTDLREGEYDYEKDNIGYSPLSKARHKEGETTVLDFITSMAGQYGPALNTTNLIVKKVFDKEKKEPDAIARDEAEKYVRIPLEILGNLGYMPLYKDVRKVIMDYIYKDLRQDKIEKERKAKTKAAIEPPIPAPFKTWSEVERNEPQLYKKLMGPGSPGYKEREAEKKAEREEREAKEAARDIQLGYQPKPKGESGRSSGGSSGGWSSGYKSPRKELKRGGWKSGRD